jgi:hypothetical protein
MTPRTYTLQRGTTRRNVLVMALGPGDLPASGVDEVQCGFVRDDGAKGAVPIVTTSPGQWESGGLVEIDPDIAPGVYQFGVPDEVLAAGATRAVVVLRAQGVSFEPLDFDIVAFDPQEPDRIGMEALTFESRVHCLTTAFPRLAVEERRRLEAERERQARQDA